MKICQLCGSPMPEGTRFCGACGRLTTPIEAAPTVVDPLSTSTGLMTVGLQAGNAGGARYAGFWYRALAWMIDYVLFLVVIFMLFVVIAVIVGIWTTASGVHQHPQEELEKQLVLLGYAIGIPAFWLYFALMESSRVQGTLGKKALKLIVTDLDGKRISFGRATGRHFAKFLSGMIFGAGFVMAAFTEKKQALHDQIADCLVVRRV